MPDWRSEIGRGREILGLLVGLSALYLVEAMAAGRGFHHSNAPSLSLVGGSREVGEVWEWEGIQPPLCVGLVAVEVEVEDTNAFLTAGRAAVLLFGFGFTLGIGGWGTKGRALDSACSLGFGAGSSLGTLGSGLVVSTNC
jgi:hypothetical protein